MPLNVIIIGAGHNGLVCAAYLAGAGHKVRVFERRHLVGGACVTEELWPGYRVSRAAYVAGLLRPKIIKELRLQDRGLKFLQRSPSSFTPLPDDRGLILGGSLESSQQEIARFSKRDAACYPKYEQMLAAAANIIEPLLDSPAPIPGNLKWADVKPLLKTSQRIIKQRRYFSNIMSLMLGPVRTVLKSWFESEPLRATLATGALIGAWAAPSTPGTGYVLLHHIMGETCGQRGTWAYVAGGMGMISNAIRDAAVAAGCDIQLEAAVQSINIEKEKAQGVTLTDGRSFDTDLVISNADPHRTLFGLLGKQHLSQSIVERLQTLDFSSPVVKINLALSELPRFYGRTNHEVGPEHMGTIHIGALSLDALEHSYTTAAQGGFPDYPMIELTIPSALDQSLAPPGHYIASLFIQHVPPKLTAESWEAKRDAFANTVFKRIDEVAPGFSSSIIHYETLGPNDLERIFALTGGNIFHGAMSLDRLLFLRPLHEFERYRTPIQNLWLCGAGTHPGGGVMGACGHNAALAILRHYHLKVKC